FIGIYAVLIPVSSYIMFHRGLATRARKILFGITIFMFSLSTVYWIASISTLIQLIRAWFLSVDPDTQTIPNYLPLFNALVLVNKRYFYILTDGVVVWRAWVICAADGRKALTMCLSMLSLATSEQEKYLPLFPTNFLLRSLRHRHHRHSHCYHGHQNTNR
ncbi:hypothetical protein BT96DRAFT_832962, partial [Gymnopus androsaceus JB14]